MKHTLLLFLAATAAHATDCAISDTLTNFDGTAFTGRVEISLNNPASSQPLYTGSTTLTGWRRTVTVTAGAFAVTLVCTDSITPSGTSYNARFIPTQGAPWTETWTPATGTTTVRAMRATTVPTPTATYSAGQVAMTATRVPYGSSGGVLTSDAYLTHTPLPASPVAGTTFSRLALTGATAPSGTYYDADYTYDFLVSRTVTSPSHTQTNPGASSIYGGAFRMAFNPSASWDNYPTLQVTAAGVAAVIDYPSGATQPINGLYGGGYEVYNKGSGAIATQRGNYLNSEVTGASNVSLNDGLYVQAVHSGTGTVTNVRGVAAIAGPSSTAPGTTNSIAVYRGIAYTYDDITTAYGYRMTRAGSVNPGTAWGISEETGWPSRFNSRVIVNSTTDNGTSALQVNGRINIPLSTPASSSATCVAGDITADASYIYFCTATNTWKRATLGSF